MTFLPSPPSPVAPLFFPSHCYLLISYLPQYTYHGTVVDRSGLPKSTKGDLKYGMEQELKRVLAIRR